jgi:hypothetical protein
MAGPVARDEPPFDGTTRPENGAMTLLAGVYSRVASDPLPDALCDSLRRALSRQPGERIEQFRTGRCYLAKADVGAFGSPALHTGATGVSFMVGEPLLAHESGLAQPRSADLREIHEALMHGAHAPLTRARGVFCAAHYRPDSGTLLLLTDKLGIRPMYYWLGERHLVFATALRILEAIADVPKALDLRGVTELSAFGYALADRTPFAGIRLMMPAEIIEARGADVTHGRYWSWEKTLPSDRSVSELAERSYHRFSESVALRTGPDSSTAAFLSGGLDSRAIVSALLSRGVRVRTFNFAPRGTQDQVFGAAFAKRVGTTHVEAPMRPGHPAWSMMMAQALADFPAPSGQLAERPRVVWSGDGGSVTLGHVYLSPTLVGLARSGDTRGVIEMMNRHWGAEVPRRLMRPSMVEALSGVTRQGLSEELGRFISHDPGRALYLLLMHNDQRRHLAEHFEGIDLHRLEFALPFFDSAFVASVLEVPLDACLGHGFYMRWLRHFPEAVMTVPWQAYPGHEPCPLPVPPELGYQWAPARSRQIRRAQKRDLILQARAVLGARDFPHALMNRTFLRLATWLYWLSVRDLAYVIRTATTYYRYWSRSTDARRQ